MDRRGFLRYFGKGVAVITAVPFAVASVRDSVTIPATVYEPEISAKDGLVSYMRSSRQEYTFFTGEKGYEAFREIVHEIIRSDKNRTYI